MVEDHKLNQAVARHFLEHCGVQVTIANNGSEAVAAVKNQLFDLVLMDLQMPELNGYQAVAEIRKDNQYKDLPIIALTAHAMEGEQERCLAAGMNDYLTKPFALADLKQILIKWIVPSISNSQAEIQVNLEKLVEQLGKESAMVPLDAVIRLVPERLDKLTDALRTNDREMAKQQAHGLKGSLNVYGSSQLSKLLYRIEDGDYMDSEADGIISSLENELGLALKLAQKMRDSLNTSS